MVIRTRISRTQTKEHFDYYDKANKFFLNFLSNPNCISVGDYLTSESHAALQSVLEFEKINRLNRNNKDLWCSENFDFLYSVEIKDMETLSSWIIGLNRTEHDWVDRKIRTTLPCVLRYSGGIVHSCSVSLNAYISDISRLYGLIKERCILKDEKSFRIDTVYEIEYINENNEFCIDEDCFHPYFSCYVNDFKITKGNNLVLISSENNKVRVIS